MHSARFGFALLDPLAAVSIDILRSLRLGELPRPVRMRQRGGKPNRQIASVARVARWRAVKAGTSLYSRSRHGSRRRGLDLRRRTAHR